MCSRTHRHHLVNLVVIIPDKLAAVPEAEPPGGEDDAPAGALPKTARHAFFYAVLLGVKEGLLIPAAMSQHQPTQARQRAELV